MSIEECPFCGKLFKRLKTHIPHCKKAPASQPLQIKEEFNKNFKKTKEDILNKRPLTKSKRKGDLQNAKTSFIQTKTEVLSSETQETKGTKSKWLAKRQKELERLHLIVPVSQKSKTTISLPAYKEELSTKQVQGTSQALKGTKDKKTLNMLDISKQLSNTKKKMSSSGIVPAIMKNHSPATESDIQQHERITIKLNKDSKLIPEAKEHQSVFTPKTSVWEHLSGSLYRKRSDYMFVPFPIVEVSKVSGISYAQQSNNKCEATVPKLLPHLLISSNQQAGEDIHSSRLQNLSSPDSERVTDRKQFSIEASCRSSQDNIWIKDPFQGPSKQVPLVQRKLGDVRLNELPRWLGTHTPSPREIVTTLNKGWQWYYRKYIDVRKGGIGGITMLLTGYCVLSYMWNFKHLKKDRWRKYH